MYKHMYMCICIYIYRERDTYVYIHTYIQIQIHIYIYIYTQRKTPGPARWTGGRAAEKKAPNTLYVIGRLFRTPIHTWGEGG